MPPRAKAAAVPATTAQALGSLLKSARDIMRKDKGLNGDLDRLPLLTWIMFLKFLDDLEAQRRAGGGPRREEVPAGARAAVSLARLGGQPSGDHRRRAAGLHQPGRGRPPRRQAREPASSPTCGGSRAPTVTTAATSSPPCSAASTTG